jgi:transcriptional regulator with XRE-family HTH domain
LPGTCQANSATFPKILGRPCCPNGYPFMDNNLATLSLMDGSRSLLAESLRLLLKAHHWTHADLAKQMGKARQWSYRLINPNKNERGTTLAMLDEICQVINRQGQIKITPPDLFDPERIRQKLGWTDTEKKSRAALPSSVTLPTYTPEQSLVFAGVPYGGVTADSVQRLELRFAHLESIMFDCYATLARYYAPGQSGARRVDQDAGGPPTASTGSSDRSPGPRKTPRKGG